MRTKSPADFWLSLLAYGSGFAALFFLLTNGIPLIQAGWLPELSSKTRYVNTMRISLSIFIVLLGLLRWKRKEVFDSLGFVRFFQEINQKRLSAACFLLFIFYTAALTAVGFFRHQALETRAYDLGIFAQAVWTTLRGHFLYSSLKGGICLLGDHVSPVLVLTAPFYALWQDPRLLLILQVLATASCLFWVVKIAQDKLKSTQIALAFAVLYFFYLPSRNVLHEDFHPETLIEPLIFLGFLWLEKGKTAGFILALIGIAAGKENMLGVTFVLGLYAFFFKKRRLLGILVMAASALTFWWEVRWLVPLLSGKAHHYQGFYHHLAADGPSLGLLKALGNGDSLEYALKVFSPFLFLPWFHPPTLLLAAPIFFQNLLSNNPVMRSFSYHYTVGLAPFLFISAIYGFEAVTRKIPWLRNRQILLAVALVAVSLFRSGPSEYYYFWQTWQHRTPHRELVRKKLRSIPSEFSVLTHNNLIPQLANRKNVYQFEYSFEPTKGSQAERVGADYVALDGEFWEAETASIEEALKEMTAGGYRIEDETGGFYLLRRDRGIS